MAMIKRAKSGRIDEVAEQTTPLSQLNIEINKQPIKDILDVPTNSSATIDVNLDEDDGDEIAVRV
jgi:hypothetical protein